MKTAFIILLLSYIGWGQTVKINRNNADNKMVFSSAGSANEKKTTDTANNGKLRNYITFSKNRNTTDETSILFPARGGKLDWGLALSGGGIRSASYSIGAMKALYDKGIMDQIDVISSVSGGGYASYWLYMNYALSDRSEKFGASAFSDDLFIKNICELQKKGNFITKDLAIKMLLKDKQKTFELYEDAIRRTFGNQESAAEKINFLNDPNGKEQTPYFIFNAALKSKELGKLGQVVEITSKYMGNPVLGFYKWKDKDLALPAMSEAVAISGAAIKWKWRRLLSNYAKEVISSDKLYLADGGLSENLGAFSLIRRGIKNVIMVDAEHDPKYEFGSYVKLRQALFNMGIDFCVEGLGECKSDGETGINFSGKSVNIGYAKSNNNYLGETPIDTKIIYIKMSKPDLTLSQVKAKNYDNSQNQTVLDKALEKGEKLLIEKNQKIVMDRNLYSCEKAGEIRFDSNMYFYRLKNYEISLENKKARNVLQKLLPKSFRHNFPQIPTFDQNYYPDELEALVALGYLQTSEW